MSDTKNTHTNYLDNIQSPQDIKGLTISQLTELCNEIRDTLINTVSQTGGHLSSNLGVVELTVAMHKVFNTPKDQFVWDVGHQCYVHKLLTGRAQLFNTLRNEGGLSGFPDPCESEHDSFIAGHSSTSISAANGMAKAKALLGSEGTVVAVIGDGAMTGGLAYEGLSNAGRSKDRLIVVLNDNGMSISQNVGFVARHLATLRARPRYVRAKTMFSNIVASIPFIGAPIRNRLLHFKTKLKKVMYSRSSFFEEMGFNYIGPLNGHDLKDLIRGFQAARRLDRPVLLHVATVKGKGYQYAEKDPDVYHGISGFDTKTGLALPSSCCFSSVFGEELCSLAEQDQRICAITAAMKSGTGLNKFGERFPNRCFDVGIAEGHAVTFAAGLAHNDALPVFAVYSTFLQRSYDQILNDAAISGEHVVLAIDRAGIVGEDGVTHQGLFDVAFLKTIPGVTVYSPSCYNELRINLRQAIYDVTGLAAVRYPRGGEPEGLKNYLPDYKPSTLLKAAGARVLLITYGRNFANVKKAADSLRASGISVSVLKLTRILPLEEEWAEIALSYEQTYFFEEGIRAGGIGESLGLILLQRGYTGKYRNVAIDGFVPSCRTQSGLEKAGLDAKSIQELVRADCMDKEKVRPWARTI
ncbi:MAG: 1-deoxy-D-xylulose-5-phosphate synthase [Oscillospiraceae bacterium]|nr:1-deoxy-D-xylulose-5-phosphate synthase [Oscillospiraceae bacterium]MDD3832488.1 1-deoxy-D-xylulose-5-phosphate synthase [Oscillospiraceae bacterium]MDD4546368.1 1-deoxy-D-xylulose-5-phosphate synthase [Oscillospiraceae bacterium]